MRKALVLIGVSSLLASGPAHADWYKLATSVNNSIWYVDPSRVKFVDGKVHVWIKVDSSHDRSVKESEAQQLLSINCSTDKVRLLSYVNYDSYGKIIRSNSFTDYGFDIGYDPIVPDSMVESVEKLVCSASSGNQ